jgi:Spy/CpxP family protein refolding chaperone
MMKITSIMVSGALLFCGGTMFAMSSDSVEGTEHRIDHDDDKEHAERKESDRGERGERREHAEREKRSRCERGERREHAEREKRSRCERGERLEHAEREKRGRGERGEHRGHKMQRASKERGRSFGKHGRQRGQLMEKILKLSEEQQKQIKALKAKNREQMQGVMRSVGDAQKALRDAGSADTLDEAKIRELSKVLADRIAESVIARGKMMKEIKALLTEDQKAKLVAKKAEWEKRKAAMKSKREKTATDKKNIKRANK